MSAGRPALLGLRLRLWLRPSRRFSLLLGLLLGLVPRAYAQAVPPLFDANWLGFEAGYEPSPFGPSSMAAGDLDGDGDIDVLTGNDYWQGPGIAVLRNAGDGSFARHEYRQLPIGQEPGTVALADIDLDGDLDALATIPGWDGLGLTLRTWRNDGAGLFTSQEDYAVGEGPQGLVVTDLDGDGFPDVVTADHGRVGRGTTLTVLRHNGVTGPLAGFLAPRTIAVGRRPYRIAAADLDGDGDPDLVVARGDVNNDTVHTVLVNDGAGNFPGPFTEYAGGRSFKPAVGLADLDRDGRPELVTSSPGASGDSLAVRRNDGAGGFASPVLYPLGTWAPTTIGLAFADLDGDTWLDVVTANPDGRAFEGLRVLLNDGGGGLLAPSRYETAQNTETVAAFDADADGDVDLLSLAHSSATLALHRNPGSGVFARTPRVPTVAFASGLEATDIDGDGDLDLALADNIRIHIHHNDGSGSFAAAVSSRPAVSPAGFRLRDLDGDGLADLVVPLAGVFVARNSGGSFDAGQTIPVGVCNDAIEAGDLDQDGDADLVAADCTFPYVLHLLRNDGGLNFSAAATIPLTLGAGRVLVADTNRDGRLDVIAHQGGYGIATFLNNGAFAFGPAVESLVDRPPGLIELGDFDQDGVPDLALQIPADAFGTDFVGVARGIGDGGFANPTLRLGSSALEILAIGTDLDVADVDCDGLADVVVTSYAANDIGVFRSRGDGVLDPEVRYGPGLTPRQSALGDFTGDGVTDVMVTIHAGGTTCCEEAVALLRGLCGCGVADPMPPDQGNVLMAVRSGADVDLRWTSATATRWRLYRDLAKTALGRTGLAPDATVTSFLDAGAIPRGGLELYRLKGLSPCSLTPGP